MCLSSLACHITGIYCSKPAAASDAHSEHQPSAGEDKNSSTPFQKHILCARTICNTEQIVTQKELQQEVGLLTCLQSLCDTNEIVTVSGVIIMGICCGGQHSPSQLPLNACPGDSYGGDYDKVLL